MLFMKKSVRMPLPEEALPGREAAIPVAEKHLVLGTPMKGPFDASLREAMFGFGCSAREILFAARSAAMKATEYVSRLLTSRNTVGDLRWLTSMYPF